MLELTNTRPPAVAGLFYDADPRALLATVDGFVAAPARAPRPVLGAMVPHAGYVYSGAICGHALASIRLPRSALILHTKHRPGGGLLSLASFARWHTPLGNVSADERLSSALAEVTSITLSNAPHHDEHAAEVVLPLLKRLRADVQIAVVSVGDADYAVLEQTAEEIAAALPDPDTLVIASSDMNHYEDHETTLNKDASALEALAALDARTMLDRCEQQDISMCGAAATALMLELSRARGATHVEVLEHTTSARTSGDFRRTVGYASALVW